MPWGVKPGTLSSLTGGKAAPSPSSGGGQQIAAPPTPFMVAIRQRDAPFHGIVAALGPAVPQPAEGGGGWEEVQLPKRASVLVWRGRGLLKLSFNLLFDNFDTGEPVHPEYETLLRLWRPDADTTPPSIVKVASRGNTIPYQELDYVISNLEWLEAEANEKGQRSQQILGLALTEYRPDERLKTATEKKKGKTTTVKIKFDGESLGPIADHYKVKGGWKALGAAQHPPIKDARHTHKGETIVVPLP